MSTIRRWERRARRRVLDTPIFGLDCHTLVSPRTGREHEFWIVDAPDWCNVVPLTDDGQVVMVRQHRHGTDETTLELPGGMVDPGDASPLEAARRELLEETGYAAGDLVATGVIQPNPAMQTNRCWSYLARGVRLVGSPHLDGGEDIEVVTVPWTSIPERVAKGEIAHALVLVAFAYALGLRSP